MSIEIEVPLNLSIVVDEQDNSIYVRIDGFMDYDQSMDYAEHLAEYLPLMLFESKVIH